MSSFPSPIKVESLWFPLIKKFYQSVYPSAKPNKSEPIWTIKDGATIIAAVRLKQFESFQLVTGLATAPTYRHQGAASTLMRSLAFELRKKESFCFNQADLIGFYAKLGFRQLNSLNDLPDELRGRFNSYRTKQPTLVAMKYLDS